MTHILNIKQHLKVLTQLLAIFLSFEGQARAVNNFVGSSSQFVNTTAKNSNMREPHSVK
jgi:hypothetical protein